MNTTAEERLEALRAMQTPMLARDATLRDMFAGMALQGMLACPLDAPGEDYPDKRDKLCMVAFEYADAMLAARKEAK